MYVLVPLTPSDQGIDAEGSSSSPGGNDTSVFQLGNIFAALIME